MLSSFCAPASCVLNFVKLESHTWKRHNAKMVTRTASTRTPSGFASFWLSEAID
jgi:hypothetical protein